MADLAHSATVDTKQIRLVLRMPRLFSFRMWLTIQVLKLAGLVSPVTLELSIGDD